jgi:hypothetical protein
MSAATEKLHPLFEKFSKEGSWRHNRANFHAEPKDKGKTYFGVLNLSSGWFQQAHDVSVPAGKMFLSPEAHFR